MQEINKEKFIADAAARIYANMYFAKDQEPDPKKAVDLAYVLWEEIVSRRGLVE